MTYQRGYTLIEKIKEKFMSKKDKLMYSKGYYKTFGGGWCNSHYNVINCKDCSRDYKNMSCPNYSLCLETKDKPFFKLRKKKGI